MAGDFDESTPTAGETIADQRAEMDALDERTAEQRIDALDKMRTDLSRVRAALDAAIEKDWNNVPTFHSKSWNRMVAAWHSIQAADDMLASAIKNLNLTRASAAPGASDVTQER